MHVKTFRNLNLDIFVVTMSDDDEVMRFEINDQDINDALNFGSKRPRQSKNRATYGIWAEDSDEENPESE